MSRKQEASVRLYIRRDRETSNPHGVPCQIIVGYNCKRLTLSAEGTLAERVNPEVFQKLNSDATPKDPGTADKEVLQLSEELTEVIRFHKAALEMMIEAGLWESATAKTFHNFFNAYYLEIEVKVEGKKVTPAQLQFDRQLKKMFGIDKPLTFKGVEL